MPNDPQTEGMKLVRYLDIYPWTKNPDEVAVVRRQDVVEPTPPDCRRIRIEVSIPKKFFNPKDMDGTVRANVEPSEHHYGPAGPPDADENPVPIGEEF